MALIIGRTVKVCWSDKKRKWDVSENDLIAINGVDFVKLPRRGNGGFSRLVFSDCPNKPKPLPNNYSLTSSLGYIELQIKRNKQHIAELSAALHQEVPALFQGLASADEQPQKKRRCVPRAEMREQRAHPQILSIDMPAFENIEAAPLMAVKPVNGRDELAVPLSDLERVIRFFAICWLLAGVHARDTHLR